MPDDVYVPSTVTPLQNFDYYQIYSVALIDTDIASKRFRHDYGLNLPPVLVRVNWESYTVNIPPLDDLDIRAIYVKIVPDTQLFYADCNLIVRVSNLSSQNITFYQLNETSPNLYNLQPNIAMNDLVLSSEGYQFVGNAMNDTFFRYLKSYYPNKSSYPPKITPLPDSNETNYASEGVAYQSFSPTGKIPFDFGDVIKTYPKYFLKLIASEKPAAQVLSGIAPKNTILTYSYYAKNHLETHPKVSNCLDWVVRRVVLKQGKGFRLDLSKIVLGTLIISDSEIKNYLLTIGLPTNNHPVSNLFPESIPGFIQSYIDAEDNTPPPLPPNIASAFTFASEVDLPALVYYSAVSTTTYKPIFLYANNNVWRYGTNELRNGIAAPDNHPIFASIDFFKLFLEPQPDGSFGSLTMNSPVLLDIWYALEAGKFTQPDANGNPPIVTLAHYLQRVSQILGYQPQPDGTFSDEVEQATKRRPMGADKNFDENDYRAGFFGRLGMLLRRITNKKTAKGWESGGYVAVHTLPQAIAELSDQLNTALNLAESTSIQIRDGASTYEYPNQLALLSEIATSSIQYRRQVREIWASSIVTQNTVNEIIAGIGLPTVSKNLTLNGQIIPYWGIQPDKSLQREIATVAYNVGLGNGQLL